MRIVRRMPRHSRKGIVLSQKNQGSVVELVDKKILRAAKKAERQRKKKK